MKMSISLVLVVLLTAITPAGEEPAPKGKGSERETVMETITVTAEGAPVELKEATAKVTVFNEREIREKLVNDVGDLVRYEPGVYVDADHSRLGLNGFNIRGIGGNRILTRIDGVSTAEQFNFGPLAINQYQIDVDTLKSVEIVRSAASSLYGSDALGGVVSFTTRDPADYFSESLGDRGFRFKSGYDSENNSYDLGAAAAFTVGEFQWLLTGTHRDYEARKNQGQIRSEDASRTSPNDIDGVSDQILAKGVYQFSNQNRLRLTAEVFDSETDSKLYTSQGVSNQFGVQTIIADSVAVDSQERFKLSLDQNWQDARNLLFDSMEWKVYFQGNNTRQRTSEHRATVVGPVTSEIVRSGTMDYEQDGYGIQAMFGKRFDGPKSNHRLTYGAAWDRQDFGQIRDRRDLDLASGNPDAYEGSLIFPTRYFPNSEVSQFGMFIQGESWFMNGRLKVTPGVRYDAYHLDPDQNDTVYLTSTGTTESPVSLSDNAISPKLGINWEIHRNLALSTHYSGGFRAPPHSSVNSGFTNVAGGYQTLPNPELEPETSKNLEFGLKAYNKKGSLGLTWFDNRYEDFIDDSVFVGVSQLGLALFQSQNLGNVKISGLELAGDYYLTESLRVRASFADITGEDRDSGAPINSIEPSKGVLGFSYRAPSKRFGGEVVGTFSAGKSAGDVSADSPIYLPESYQLLDLTFFYNLTNQMSLHLGGFNLTDETWYSWSQVRGQAADSSVIDRYSSPGSTFSLNFRYQW